jgi:hypothetical protein
MWATDTHGYQHLYQGCIEAYIWVYQSKALQLGLA